HLNSGGFGYISNGGSAKSEGVEFSLQARPLERLTISGWADYDNAVLTSNLPAASTSYGVKGTRLPSTPKLSAQLTIQQDFPVFQDATGFVALNLNYVGDRLSPLSSCGSPCTASPRTVYPAYTKTDLRGGVDYGTWKAELYVNNIGDVRGITNGGNGYYTPF